MLQAYARHRSEPAFAALVARHVNLVYSAAIRQVRDAHLAKDVAQQVFAELARQAPRMKPDTLLAAWLHAATRRRAIDVVRSEVRRRQREQTALELADANAAAPDAEWSQVAPLLDEALHALPSPERDAVLLRYFEDKSLRAVGETLGISDDAAQKRVHRALERLRAHFVKRRVPLGAAGLAALLSGHAVQAAPAGLAAQLSAAAIVSGAGVAVVTQTLAMTTLQKSLVASALALSLGFGVYEARQVARLNDKLAALEQTADQIRRANEYRLAELAAENTRLLSEANRLRAEAAAPSVAEIAQDPLIRAMADWLERAKAFRVRFRADATATIPEIRWVREMDWLDVTKDNRLENEVDYRRAATALRSVAENIFAEKAHDALKKYTAANAGKFPTDLSQLQPYFGAPVDSAILSRWVIEPASRVNSVNLGGDWVVTQIGFSDEELDQRIVVSERGTASSQNDDRRLYRAVIEAYAAANPGQRPANLQELMPYATTPQQKAVVERYEALAAKRKSTQN